MEALFTWIETHGKLVEFLRTQEFNQPGLIELLKSINIDPFNDRDENDQIIPLQEIDPFTFFAYLYKYGEARRIENLQAIAKKLDLPIPSDVSGVPTANPQSVWYFGYKKIRQKEDVSKLWTFFKKAIDDNLTDPVFKDVLNIKKVGKSKLTEGLFFILPHDYLPLDKPVKTYLKQEFELDSTYESYSDYRSLLEKVRSLTKDSFPIISHKAWLNDTKSDRINALKKDSLDMGEPDTSRLELKQRLDPPTSLPLNLILYGPPGTGKTYHTINRALEILGEQTEGLNREQVTTLYQDKLKEGRICFTTFHQSMSYEDFMEGIKPIAPEEKGDPVNYEVASGIFKSICLEASYAIAKGQLSKETEKTLDFSAGYDLFVTELEERLSTQNQVPLETKSGGKILVDSISSQGNIIVKHHQGIRTYTVSKKRLTKIHQMVNDLDDIHNINIGFREIIGGSNTSAYWAVLNAVRTQNINSVSAQETRTFTTEDDKVQVVAAMQKNDFRITDVPPYVLIIDEINRGNISKIFGELITLIEQDKRRGGENELTVTLPYSKETFGVPPNLYILGTMNTADRSIALLDTALRRRFEFEEMMPDHDLDELRPVEHEGITIDLKQLLKTINQRIEFLFDRDHTIGHAYFIGLKDFKDLCNVFRNKVIPLLQEYFYEDWEKIRLVLGANDEWNSNREEQLVSIKHNYSGDNEKELFGLDLDEYEEIKIHEIHPDLMSKKFDDLDPMAFVHIYKKPVSE